MNTLLLAGASGAGAVIAGQVLTTVFTFAVVLWVLKAFALKPILLLLEERRKTVSNEFHELDRKIAEADARLKEYEEKLKHIDEEARERHNRAVDEGRRMAGDLIEKARRDSEEITEKARETLQHELEVARLELRRSTVELTLAATGKLLETTMDDARQKDLVESFISDLEKRA